jgi:selenide,water dikinase
MLGRGDVGAQIRLHDVPVLEAAWDFVARDIVPGGTRRNLASVESIVDWSERLSDTDRLILADAQTSGGLLIAADPAEAQGLLTALRAHGVADARIIGTFSNRLARIEVV